MSTYEAMQAKKRELESLSVEELERRCQETTAKRCELEDEERKLEWALKAARERRERERPDTLTPEDEKELRRSLTIVGELMTGENVSGGSFGLVDEEPGELDMGCYGEVKKAWSLDIQTGFHLEVGPSLWVRATLKTKNAKVRAIVREMITSNEHIRDREKHEERTYWDIDWDYGNRIEIRNPMTREQYDEKRKRY
jgi:hypothetical protein